MSGTFANLVMNQVLGVLNFKTAIQNMASVSENKHFDVVNNGFCNNHLRVESYIMWIQKIHKQRYEVLYIYKTTRVCWYDPLYILRFYQLVPWKHEYLGRVLSGHQLGKPSDVRRIISTHEGSFVFIIHPTWNII